MGPGAAPTRGRLRLLRGAAIGVVSTLLAAFGHASAGGSVAGLGTLAVLGALMTTLTIALADRRPRPMTTLATVGAAQLVLHELMQVMATHPHYPGTAPDPGQPGPMIAAHVLATIASAMVLSRADDMIFLFAAVLSRVVRRRPRPRPVPDVAVVVLPAPVTVDALRAFLFALVVGQRGPPVPE